MYKFIKKYNSYIIMFLSVIITILSSFIFTYDFSDLFSTIEEELEHNYIFTIYSYIFQIIGKPIIQGCSLALILMVYYYFISLIFYGIASITKIKVKFTQLLEAFIKSYSVVVIKKVVYFIYYSFYGTNCSNPFIRFIFATLQIILFCKLIASKIEGDKTNKIIYNVIVIVTSTIVNVIILLLGLFLIN